MTNQTLPHNCKSVSKLLSRPERWCQGSLFKLNKNSNPVSCCLTAALQLVYGDSAERKTAEAKLCRAIARNMRKNPDKVSINRFNDYKTTNFDRIQAVLEKAKI